jgi:hypothetical protein
MNTNDQDMRTAVHKAVSKALHDNQFADGWPEMVDPVVDAVMALTPAQAPDKAGEREGVADTVRETCADLAGMKWPKGSDDVVGRAIRLITDLAAIAPQPNGTEASRGVGAEDEAEKYAEESYQLGKRDGYEEGVQAVAWAVGLDGEYRCSPDPDRHVPDPATMIERIAEHFQAATPTPPLSPDSTGPEILATQIRLGEGLTDITRIDHEGKTGVLFRPRAQHIPNGEPGELPAGEYWPVPGDVVLWVGPDGAQVAIDHLAALTPSAPIAAPVRDDGAREALIDALKPFAECCDNHFHDASILETFSASHSVLHLIRDGKLTPTGVSVGDLRRARAIVAGESGSDGKDTHRRLMGPLADWARSLDGRPVSTADLARLVTALASLPAPAGDVPGEAQTKAARDVLAERRRQVEAEGWTSEHDDAHGKGEIARAAATYAMAGAMQTSYLRDNFLGEWVNYKFSDVRSQWPGSWDWSWFKPSHPRRDLVKAAALILAEIERLDRLPGEAQTQEGGR